MPKRHRTRVDRVYTLGPTFLTGGWIEWYQQPGRTPCKDSGIIQRLEELLTSRSGYARFEVVKAPWLATTETLRLRTDASSIAEGELVGVYAGDVSPVIRKSPSDDTYFGSSRCTVFPSMQPCAIMKCLTLTMQLPVSASCLAASLKRMLTQDRLFCL